MADKSTHLMLDDVNVGLLEAHASPAFAIAGYVDGKFKNLDEIAAKYGKTRKYLLSIDVFAKDRGAECLDIENGDATNAQAPAWFKATKAAGEKARDHRWFPKLYTSASNVEALIAEMTKAGVKRSEYMIWSAHYTGKSHICSPHGCGYPQADATQFSDKYDGVSLDGSLCYGYFFAGPPAVTAPKPKGPFWHKSEGKGETFNGVIAREKATLEQFAVLNSQKLNAKHLRLFVRVLATPGAAMPAGTVYWTAK